jgi:hypothetical protein
MSIDLTLERWDLVPENNVYTELDFRAQDVVSLSDSITSSINTPDISAMTCYPYLTTNDREYVN